MTRPFAGNAGSPPSTYSLYALPYRQAPKPTGYTIAGTLAPGEVFAVSQDRKEVIFFAADGSFHATGCTIKLEGAGCSFSGKATWKGRKCRMWGDVALGSRLVPEKGIVGYTRVRFWVQEGIYIAIDRDAELRQ